MDDAFLKQLEQQSMAHQKELDKMTKNMGFGFSGMTDNDLLAELGGPSSKKGIKGNTVDDIMRELGLDPDADENMDDDNFLAEIDRKAAMKPI